MEVCNVTYTINNCWSGADSRLFYKATEPSGSQERTCSPPQMCQEASVPLQIILFVASSQPHKHSHRTPSRPIFQLPIISPKPFTQTSDNVYVICITSGYQLWKPSTIRQHKEHHLSESISKQSNYTNNSHLFMVHDRHMSGIYQAQDLFGSGALFMVVLPQRFAHLFFCSLLGSMHCHSCSLHFLKF